MSFLKKQFSFGLLLFFVALIFFPVVSFSATPENNPMCWTKKSCQQIIEKSDWKWNEAVNFEIKGPGGICGTELGACIPAGGQTLTEISIGGQVKFNNLGEYIKTIYLWVVGIGGTVAVILIIIGGFIYMTSAGSPDRVKAAKERIGSAILGLLLLLGSYTLLYTINPDLVRLRLPQVYMLRPISLVRPLCKDVTTENIAYGGLDEKNLKTPADSALYYIDPRWLFTQIKKTFGGQIPTPAQTAALIKQQFPGVAEVSYPARMPVCGAFYHTKSGDAPICLGDFCPPINGQLQSCVFAPGETKSSAPFKCVAAYLGGKYTFRTDMGKNNQIGQANLWEVCKNGHVVASPLTLTVGNVADESSALSSQGFYGSGTSPKSNCGDGTFGYALSFQSSGGSRNFYGCVASKECSVDLRKMLIGETPGFFDFVTYLNSHPADFDKVKTSLIDPRYLNIGYFINVDLSK